MVVFCKLACIHTAKLVKRTQGLVKKVNTLISNEASCLLFIAYCLLFPFWSKHVWMYVVPKYHVHGLRLGVSVESDSSVFVQLVHVAPSFGNYI